MNSYLKQITHQLLIAVLLLFSLTACGGGARPFVTLDNAIIKPARIAVISGEADDLGKNLALAVTEELQKRTNFNVISQQEVAKKIRRYPSKVEFAFASGETPSVWLTTKEAKKMKAIQAKLKADYVFIVWGTNLSSQTISNQYGSKTYYNMSVFGNMLQYPSGKAVAFSDFSTSRKVKFWEAVSFKKSSYFVEALIKRCADMVVNDFIRATNSGKA